jgi:proteasome lid subunit RPN8/RPN11
MGDSIVDAAATGNLSGDPSRFFVDPKDHIAARRDARRRGIDVIGFYHSHPLSAAVPSPTDVAEAGYPGYLYLIVGLATDPVEARLFRFDDGRFAEVALVSSAS